MKPLLKVKNLSKKYNTINGEIEAIKDISLEVKNGEFIAIIGTSGCGKSTLLSILAGLEEKSNGEITYCNDKNDIKIGYMLQEDALFEHYSILDNVLIGLKIQKKLNQENKEYVLKLLEKYQLTNFKNKKPHELSGGMKQRVVCI